MSRIATKNIADLSQELQNVMSKGSDLMGFTPNNGLIMAHKPQTLSAFWGLVQAIYQPGALPAETKKLVGLMTSAASGCQYCEAHTSFSALNNDVDETNVAAIWEYQTNPLFNASERAALEVARNAALLPNAVTDQNFIELAKYYTEEQIVELVSVISLFGFLNRFNATFKTDIESAPLEALNRIRGRKLDKS
jgi:uncharacterized peroxidase-related enzyme